MHDFSFNLVLGDISDLLQAAAPLILMVLYGIAQLVGGKQAQAKRQAAAPPRPRPLPVEQAKGAAPRPAGAPPSLEESLRREVEEFMRRAQGQQPQQVKQVGPPPPQREAPKRNQRERPKAPMRQESRRPARTEPLREQPRRLAEPLRPMGPPASRTPTSTPSPAATLAPLGSGVAQHVAQHLRGAAEIGAHAQQLGAGVSQTDERMEQHLKDKFVHQLGSLTQQQVTNSQHRAAATTPLAQDLLNLLARPGGARQVIVASEILGRHKDPWS